MRRGAGGAEVVSDHHLISEGTAPSPTLPLGPRGHPARWAPEKAQSLAPARAPNSEAAAGVGARAPQPTVMLKPQWNLLRQWLRKAPRARVTGSGGIFFSSTAPTHQLLSTTPLNTMLACGRVRW